MPIITLEITYAIWWILICWGSSALSYELFIRIESLAESRVTGDLLSPSPLPHLLCLFVCLLGQISKTGSRIASNSTFSQMALKRWWLWFQASSAIWHHGKGHFNLTHRTRESCFGAVYINREWCVFSVLLAALLFLHFYEDSLFKTRDVSCLDCPGNFFIVKSTGTVQSQSYQLHRCVFFFIPWSICSCIFLPGITIL